jgi:hypothetical protein
MEEIMKKFCETRGKINQSVFGFESFDHIQWNANYVVMMGKMNPT